MNIKIENWKLLVLSVFYIIFGILSYTIEKVEFLNFFKIAGIVIILIGLFQILVYFFKKEYLKHLIFLQASVVKHFFFVAIFLKMLVLQFFQYL